MLALAQLCLSFAQRVFCQGLFLLYPPLESLLLSLPYCMSLYLSLFSSAGILLDLRVFFTKAKKNMIMAL